MMPGAMSHSPLLALALAYSGLDSRRDGDKGQEGERLEGMSKPPERDLDTVFRVETAGSKSQVQEVSKQLQNGVSLKEEEASGAKPVSKPQAATGVKAGGSWAKIAAPKVEEVTAE